MEIHNSTSIKLLQHSSKENGNKYENNSAENGLSEKDQKLVEKLKKEDKRVRAHENAHKAAAGNLSKGGPSYKFKMGPDGKKYAVSGHVKIDTAEIKNDPEATLMKAKKIRSAALAPSDPSAQDLKVARDASRLEAKARQQLSKSENHSNELSPKNEDNKYISSYIDQSALRTSRIDLKF